MRARDLETLEFTRVLDTIAALARSAAGRQAVLELRPTSERTEAERRLDLLAELVALAAEAGRPPTADVPLLAPALAAAAPDGAPASPLRSSARVRTARLSPARGDSSRRWAFVASPSAA